MMNTGLWRGRRAGYLVTGALAAMLSMGTAALAQQQSPMLDALVQSGELPPVAERLPTNPLVVTPVESVGKYGGTWHSALRGGLDNAWIARTVAYDGLVRYDREWKQIIPNIAESWEISEDARTYTFKLRQGLKWNNGKPFTSADIAFAVELLKEPTYPGGGGFVKNPQNPVNIEVVDDTTFKFVFENPNGVLMDELASVNGLTIVSLSKDYCGQFYPKYNPNAAADAKAAGFETWELYMQDRCSWATETIRWGNPELPFMNAWKVVAPLKGDSTRVTFERNPYYWKVDTEGNQLPYIDRLEMRVSDSLEELTLMALNGEIDFQDRHIATIINQPIFFDGQEAGDYRLGRRRRPRTPIPWCCSSTSTMSIRPSASCSRTRISASAFPKRWTVRKSSTWCSPARACPSQVAPRPESPFYDEEMSQAIYRVQSGRRRGALRSGRARAQEWRWLLHHGRTAHHWSITIDTIAAFRAEWVDMLEMMQLQLEAAGIDIEINNIDRTLYYDKRPLGDYDAQVWQGDGGLDVVQEPRYYFPANPESVWAFRWRHGSTAPCPKSPKSRPIGPRSRWSFIPNCVARAMPISATS